MIKKYLNSSKLAESVMGRLHIALPSPTIPNSDAPIFFAKGEGCCLYDADGNRYVDFSSGEGKIILGHCDPDITREVVSAVSRKGVFSDCPTKYYADTINLISSAFNYDVSLLFFPSGTSAVRSAVEASKLITKKPFVLSAGYHGWDPVWNPSGAMLAPNSAGIVDWLYVLDYLELALKKYQGKVASVCFSPDYMYFDKAYYRQLKALVKKYSVMLLCDDVMQGFRYSFGPSLDKYNLKADIYVFSKGLANGARLACVAGERDMIRSISTHVSSGYLNTIPFIYSAITLAKLKNGCVHRQMATAGNAFVKALRTMFVENNFPCKVYGDGMFFQFVFPKDADESAFYSLSLQEGLFFEPGWNQSPSYAFTAKVYNNSLTAIRRVCEKVFQKDSRTLFDISMPRKLETAWRILHGCADICSSKDKTRFLKTAFNAK